MFMYIDLDSPIHTERKYTINHRNEYSYMYTCYTLPGSRLVTNWGRHNLGLELHYYSIKKTR